MDDWVDPGFFGPTTVIVNREPLVVITVSWGPISFLLSTEATYLVLPEIWGPTSSPSSSSVIRRHGHKQSYWPHLTSSLSCIFKGIPLTHFFLVILTYLFPLLGRGLLAKKGASISVTPPHLLSSRLTSHPTPQQAAHSDKLFPLWVSQINLQVWDT